MADARYDAAANLIRLSVPQPASPSPAAAAALRSLLQPGPGVHYYLYFPTLWRGCGNHPFTLASWTPSAELRAVSGAAAVAPLQSPTPSTSGSARSTPTAAAADNKKHAARVTASTAAAPYDASVGEVLGAHANDTADPDAQCRLMFLLRPHAGPTHHLRSALLAAPGQRKRVAVLVEGPYGAPAPVLRRRRPAAATSSAPSSSSSSTAAYDTLLFIAGGSNTAGLLGYLQHHAEACRASAGPAAVSANKKSLTNVHMVWAACELAFVQRVLVDADLRGIFAAQRCVMGIWLDVFVTGNDSAAAAASATTKTATLTTTTAAARSLPAVYSEKSGGGGGGVDAPNVTLHMHQRPDVARIVAETARDAIWSPG